MTTLNTDIGASCVIKIFTGTVPSDCATVDTGTLLVTFAGNAASFGSAAAGVLTTNSVGNATATGTGTAGYFRIYPNAATTTNAVMQGTCGVAGTDMILTSTSINSGQVIQFTSMTVTAFGA
jgi:hypothetical protein